MSASPSSSCSSLPRLLVQTSAPVFKPVRRILMRLPLKKSFTFRIRSSFHDQVFEDRSNGIICYRDANGEMICEGYDEGPRIQYQHQIPRDVEMVNLIQQRLLRIVHNHELNRSDTSVAVQEDYN